MMRRGSSHHGSLDDSTTRTLSAADLLIRVSEPLNPTALINRFETALNNSMQPPNELGTLVTEMLQFAATIQLSHARPSLTPLEQYSASEAVEAVCSALDASPNSPEDERLPSPHAGYRPKLRFQTPDPATVDRDNCLALVMAAQGGHVSSIEALLEGGVDVGVRLAEGWTPLMIAARSGAAGAVARLLAAGCNVNARLDNGWSTLMLACAAKQPDVVQLLLYARADVHSCLEDGTTPTVVAAQAGDVLATKALLAAGAIVNRPTSLGWTPLLYASQDGSVPMVTLLLDARANANARSKDGLTPLLAAAQAGHARVMDVLLEAGADPGAKDRRGLTAAQHFARQAAPPAATSSPKGS